MSTDRPATTSSSSSPHLRRVAKLISTGKAQSIIVLTGAGISTSAGIPDFRSPTTGLYANLQRLKLPFPEAVFELNYFKRNPKPFWTLAKELYPGKHFPTPTHYFLTLLNKHNHLSQVFSQNIDTLDLLASLPPEKIVEAHGSFAASHCLSCGLEVAGEYVLESGVREGKVVYCPHPVGGAGLGGKGGKGGKGKGGECGGLVKPDIVFFGEGLPDRFFEKISALQKCDLLIVIGTSLQVQPFASLVERVKSGVPRILINKEPAGPFHPSSSSSSSPPSRKDVPPSSSSRKRDRPPQTSASLQESKEGTHTDGYDSESSDTDTESEEDTDNPSCEEGEGGEREERDMFHQGDADSAIWELANLLGWSSELQKEMEEGNKALAEKWGVSTPHSSSPVRREKEAKGSNRAKDVGVEELVDGVAKTGLD